MHTWPCLRQVKRLDEDLRQRAPIDGNVYINKEYHQAPHHYIRASSAALPLSFR